MADDQLDPVARARAIAARLAATAIPSDTLGKRKSRWEDDVDGGARPAPGGFAEKKRKKVYIPVDKYPDINFMGLLIGPRGSNQKRMEDESGARILIRGKGSSKDAPEDGDDAEELHVVIEADSDEAIAKAQSAVEDILFNPQQAMKLKQEQLRKVAELNGTLNDNYGPRDSEYGGGGGSSGKYGPSSGSADGGHGGYGGPSSYGGGGASSYGGSGPSRDASTDMQVPRDLVGYIIGRGGETIRDLQLKSGAHIQIVREEEGAPATPHRFVNISGTEDALQRAQTMIQNLIDERLAGGRGSFRERDDNDRMARYGGINPDGTDTMELHVPNERVGLIIGRGGATIKSIQMRTGSSITIPQTPDPNHPSMRLISIRGTLGAKEAAKQEILSILSDDSGPRVGGTGGAYGSSTIYMQIPNDRVGVVIGKRGETIKGIQDRCYVRIQIPTVPDPGSNPPVRTVSIQGPPEMLQRAKDEVDNIVLQGAGSQGYGGGAYGSGASAYGASASYGGGYDQQQQYGAYGQAQAAAGQYDAYYQQQYAAAAADPTATAAAATAAAAPTAATTTAAATGATTADPNDPNAYWNGYYEYAAYYGVDAANAAWGVTGAAAQASAEAYQQYQAAAGATGAADSAAASAAPGAAATDAASTSTDASQVC